MTGQMGIKIKKIKNELKYYFKYMMKEYKELLPLFATFKSSRDAYESSFKKVKKSTTANPKEEKSMATFKKILLLSFE